MNRTAFIICLLFVAVGAIAHGASTRRWGSIGSTESSASKLHAHAVELGDYQSEQIPNDLPVKEKSQASSRRYFSPSKNLSIAVSVITGPPGAVSTHTPDVCYPSSGFKTVKEPKRERIDLPGGAVAEYYVAEFEKKSATRTDRVRVRWAWSPDCTWTAPDKARLKFLSVAELVKVYIVTSVSEADTALPAEDSPAVRQFVTTTFAQYAGLMAGR